MKHIKYLSYVIRHKWFVLIAGLKIGCNPIRLILHDLSKFRPSEWFPYADNFYGNYRTMQEIKQMFGNDVAIRWGKTKDMVEMAFDVAWLKHIHRNPHHWQHWILREDSGKNKYIPIPRKYIKEMVADWMGAGRAITGKWDAKDWYAKNKDKIRVDERSRKIIETLLKDE